MNKENLLWWVCGLIFALLVFSNFLLLYLIGYNYQQGQIEGKQSMINYFMEQADKEGYIILNNPNSDRQIVFIEYSQAQERCHEVLEDLFK